MATTLSAATQAGTGNNGRRLGLALTVIATAQLMVVRPLLVAAGIAVLMLVAAVTMIRSHRTDVAGR